MRAFLLSAAALLLASPLAASTYFEVEKTCPVGGEKFKFMELGSISTFGYMPDGMPIGSGLFPIEPPVCPGNGLVMYREFDAAQVKQLEGVVAAPAYQALRKSETPLYLAYKLADALGDRETLPWLLLQASWQAKNAGAQGPLARRYNEEFAAYVRAQAADPASLESIALRARAANALRELGRFDEAEALRAAIVIGPEAGGGKGAENRKGWRSYLDALAAPIARKDRGRTPIDLMNLREAAFRCMAKELNDAAPPLTPFEAEYCKRGEVAKQVAEVRKLRGN
jgi:hypothetical protein